MDKGITRREFVRQAVEHGLGLTAAAASLSYGAGSVFASSSREEFDFIVVGSGAGGGPVAANLAQAGYRVLLLEAGANYAGQNYRVPGFCALSTEDPQMAWSFFVNHYRDPARAARDSKYVPGKGVLYPRAGTLGGCTAHNDMITLYPENRDWDGIAALTGDPSWESSRMRDYFQRLEACQYLKPTDENSPRHGFKGWLPTELADSKLALQDPELLDLILGSTLGRGTIQSDPNAWEYVQDEGDGGIITLPMSTLNGQRRGSRERILDTVAKYPDRLTLRTNCLATRVIFSDVDRTLAIGVEYLSGATLYRADARASAGSAASAVKTQSFAAREVILAGGAFNTPQLLMLSGVGPAAALRAQGIDVRIDSPGVGKNLQDRYEISVATEVKSDFDLIKNCTLGETGDPCLAGYEKNPKMSAYSSNGVVLSFIRKSSSAQADPDLCLFGVLGKFRGYYPGWSRDVFQKDVFSWAVLKGHTLNTAGEVKLKSADPLDTPEISFNYFEEGNDRSGQDLESVLAGFKYARELNQSPISRLVEKDEVGPGREIQSDDQIRQYIRDEAWGHHASCTNRMGQIGDPMAVLDSSFRVQGAKGLRVVDASVFPRIPGLFIVASVYMIAEKASDAILGDARAR